MSYPAFYELYGLIYTEVIEQDRNKWLIFIEFTFLRMLAVTANRKKEKESRLLRVWQQNKHNHESLLPKSNHDCYCPSHRG